MQGVTPSQGKGQQSALPIDTAVQQPQPWPHNPAINPPVCAPSQFSRPSQSPSFAKAPPQALSHDLGTPSHLQWQGQQHNTQGSVGKPQPPSTVQVCVANPIYGAGPDQHKVGVSNGGNGEAAQGRVGGVGEVALTSPSVYSSGAPAPVNAMTGAADNEARAEGAETAQNERPAMATVGGATGLLGGAAVGAGGGSNLGSDGGVSVGSGGSTAGEATDVGVNAEDGERSGESQDIDPTGSSQIALERSSSAV
ncbi:hypothetical protein VTK56DRAFT_10182 [Thermocarpiscus australiensis]